MPGVRPGLHDEQFLEYLAAAKSGAIKHRPSGGRFRLRLIISVHCAQMKPLPCPQVAPVHSNSLRRLNRLRVIRALRDEGQISRAEIARRTGLSRSTVSSLVADLQADGLVVERPEPGSAHGAQGGRPPILLSFDASAGAAVGVDFGHSHLRVAVSDLAATILAERTRPLDTDHDAYEGLDMAAELVVETLADAGVGARRP